MSWSSYLQEHTQGEVGRVTADKLGVTESNVSRWRRGGQTPDARHVVNFARVYGRPVLEALVAAEFLTEAEAKVRPSAAPSLNSLTDEELVQELLARLRRGGGGDDRDAAPMTTPDSAHAGGAADVHQFPTAARHAPSQGKTLRARLDQVGEESQDTGGEDPA